MSSSSVDVIDENRTVDDLKKAIVKEIPGRFAADELALWKVGSTIDITDIYTFLARHPKFQVKDNLHKKHPGN